MGEIDILKAQAETMPDQRLLECVGAGTESFRPGVYDVYLAEARKRGLDTDGAAEKATRAAGREARKNIVANYIYAAVPVFGLFLFVTRSVQLLLHRAGKRTIAEAMLRHYIRQWRLSIASFFTTAVFVMLFLFGGTFEISM